MPVLKMWIINIHRGFSAVIHKSSSSCSAFQNLGENEQVVIDHGVLETEIGYGAAGMQNRGVVSSAEGFADGRQAGRGQFLGKPHGDLAWAGHDARSLLGVHVGNLDLVVFGHGFLDRLESDLAVVCAK